MTKKSYLCLLTLLPFYVMATSIKGIKADGDSKVFSLDDVMSIKVDNESNLAVYTKSGDVNGGFQEIKFSEEISSVEENKSDLAVKVYPNPVKSILYLVGADADTRFEIISTDGKVVMKGQGESVNVSNIASGQYVIVAGGKRVKFIKE